MKLKTIVLSPYTLFGALACGILTSRYVPQLINTLSLISGIYKTLLQMSVLPIMISAIVTSFGKIFKSSLSGSYLRKMAIGILSMFAVATLVGMLPAALPRIITPDDTMKRELGEVIVQTIEEDEIGRFLGFQEISYTDEAGPADQGSALSDFLTRLVPDNIFASLARGEALKIVGFFIFFSIALSSIDERFSGAVFRAFEGIYLASLRIVNGVLLAIPIGIWAMTAVQFRNFGFGLIASLFRLLAVFYVVSILLFLIVLAGIRITRHIPMNRLLSAFREMLLLGLTTRNSFAALPSGITGLSRGLNLERHKSEGVFTLGVTMFRYGVLVLYGVTLLFTLPLYGQPLTVSLLGFVVPAMILTTIAGSGAPSLIVYSLIGIIIEPLGVPAEISILILTLLDPFLDPVITVLNLWTNCGVAVFTAADSGKEQKRAKKGGCPCEE